MNRRHFLQLGPASLAALTAPFSGGRIFAQNRGEPPEIGRSSHRAKKPKPAILELGNRQSLRLLQFTDNHFFCGVQEGLAITEADRKTERDDFPQAHIERGDEPQTISNRSEQSRILVQDSLESYKPLLDSPRLPGASFSPHSRT